MVKKGPKKIGQGPPPLFGQCLKEKNFGRKHDTFSSIDPSMSTEYIVIMRPGLSEGGGEARLRLVRFPNPLASGSGWGAQYP